MIQTVVFVKPEGRGSADMANRINPRFQVQHFIDELMDLLGSSIKTGSSPKVRRMREPTGTPMPKRRFTPTEANLARTRQLFTKATSPSSVVKGRDKSLVSFSGAVSDYPPGSRRRLEEALKRIASPTSRKEFLRKWEEAIDAHVPDGTY
jgi:hypothetical protein